MPARIAGSAGAGRRENPAHLLGDQPISDPRARRVCIGNIHVLGADYYRASCIMGGPMWGQAPSPVHH